MYFNSSVNFATSSSTLIFPEIGIKYSFDLTKAIKNGLNPELSSEKSVRKLIEELHLNG